jgi:hypothetical protein
MVAVPVLLRGRASAPPVPVMPPAGAADLQKLALMLQPIWWPLQSRKALPDSWLQE